jgi:hypothetical protein
MARKYCKLIFPSRYPQHIKDAYEGFICMHENRDIYFVTYAHEQHILRLRDLGFYCNSIHNINSDIEILDIEL